MTHEVGGRVVIRCDRCGSQVDLGPVNHDPFPRRSPSGWMAMGDNKYLCPLCSPGYTSSFIRRFG